VFIKLSTQFSNLRLLIVGPSSKNDHLSVDEKFLNQQKQKIELNLLNNKVFWTGMVKNLDEMAGYYSASDIVVFPTRGEGIGNVLIEALFAGLPIVVTRLNNITDSIIVDGENGFLVDVDDLNGFSESISMLIRHPEIREKMGNNNHEKAIRSLSFDIYCQRLSTFYTEVNNS